MKITSLEDFIHTLDAVYDKQQLQNCWDTATRLAQPTNQVQQLLCCPDCLAWFSKEYLDGFRLQGNENWIECPNCSVGTHDKDWKEGKAT